MVAEGNGLAEGDVLLVEDDFILGDMVKVMLDQLGCKTTGPVASARRALPLIQSGKFDVALLDVRLIDGNSEPLAVGLRARGCPVIFMTAYADFTPENPILGGVPQLIKPFDFSELAAEIERALGNASPR